MMKWKDTLRYNQISGKLFLLMEKVNQNIFKRNFSQKMDKKINVPGMGYCSSVS